MLNGCKWLVRVVGKHPKCGYAYRLLCDPAYRGCVATADEKQKAAKTIAEEIGGGEGKEKC